MRILRENLGLDLNGKRLKCELELHFILHLHFEITILAYKKREKKRHIYQLKAAMVHSLCLEANKTAGLSS